MNYERSVCVTLMNQVSFAVGKLRSILRELPPTYQSWGSPMQASVSAALRDLRNELQSALQEAHLVTTTEPPTSTPTKSPNTLNDTLAATEASVHQTAANTLTIASVLENILTVLRTGGVGCSGCEKCKDRGEVGSP